MLRIVLALFGLICFAALSGCRIAGYAASIYGTPPVPAAYEPAKTPMVVVVKDAPDPMGLVVESDALALKIEQQITQYEIAPLIPSSKLSEVRSLNLGGFAAMTPAQIGRAVGADQVLYVKIISSSLGSDGGEQMIKGLIETQVSVIDTNTGTMLWPKQSTEGMTVTYSTPMMRVSSNTNPLTVTVAFMWGWLKKLVGCSVNTSLKTSCPLWYRSTRTARDKAVYALPECAPWNWTG
jgi:hypothetical protein